MLPSQGHGIRSPRGNIQDVSCFGAFGRDPSASRSRGTPWLGPWLSSSARLPLVSGQQADALGSENLRETARISPWTIVPSAIDRPAQPLGPRSVTWLGGFSRTAERRDSDRASLAAA